MILGRIKYILAISFVLISSQRPSCQDVLYGVATEKGITQHYLYKYNPYSGLGSWICTTQTWISRADVFPSLYTNELNAIYNVPELWWYKFNNCIRVPKYKLSTDNQTYISNGADVDRYGYTWSFGSSGVYRLHENPFLFEYKGPMVPHTTWTYSGDRLGAYLNGKIYFVAKLTSDSIGVNRFYYYIYKADTSDSANPSILSGPFDTRTFSFAALSPAHLSCGEDRLLIGDNYTNSIYDVNLNNGNLTYLSTLPLDPDSISINTGAAYWNFDPRQCDVFIDLDINNSSGDMKNGYVSNYSCFNKYTLLSDIDPDVYSEYGIMDSITVEIINPLNGNLESIRFNNQHNVIGAFQNQSLSLFPSLTATNDSFELALQDLQYINNACSIIEGDRFIQIITYKNNIRDTAICKISVIGPFYNAGLDSIKTVCSNEKSFNLSDLLGNCYTPGGQWDAPTLIPGIFNPSKDAQGIYKYIIGDSNCGYDTATIQIFVNKVSIIDLGPDRSLCTTDSLVINLPSTNSYLWQDGMTNPKYVIHQPGLYFVNVTDLNACSFRDSIEVMFSPNSTINKTLAICSDHLFQYKNKSYKSGDIIHDTLSGINTCDTILNLQLISYPISKVSITADTLICKNKTTLITASPTNKYLWSTGETVPTITKGPGTYQLTVTDYNLCTTMRSITIKEAPPIEYIVEPYDPLCSDDRGRIVMQRVQGGIPPVRYLLNSVENKSGIFDNLNPGQYIATFIDAIGCEIKDTIIILPAAAFDVSVTNLIEIDKGASVLVNYTATQGQIQNIRFDPNLDISQEGNALRIMGTKDRDYTITFIDSNGCEVTHQLQIRIIDHEEFYIPNLFSPNHDNVNDTWQPTIGTSLEVRQIAVYDRWGESVFSTSDRNTGWNGLCHNKPCVPGVYVYLIQLKDKTGKVKTYSGDLTLVR